MQDEDDVRVLPPRFVRTAAAAAQPVGGRPTGLPGARGLRQSPEDKVDVDHKNHYISTDIEAMRVLLGEKVTLAGLLGSARNSAGADTCSPEESHGEMEDSDSETYAGAAGELLFVRPPVLMFVPESKGQDLFNAIKARRVTVRCPQACCALTCAVFLYTLCAQVSASGDDGHVLMGAAQGARARERRRGRRKPFGSVGCILKADLPADPFFVAEVLAAAGIARVRVVSFGAKQQLKHAIDSFKGLRARKFMTDDDMLHVDLGYVEVAAEVLGSAPAPETFTALAAVDPEGRLWPYAYFPKAAAQQLTLESYPQFGSILGTEYGQGSFTLHLLVSACVAAYVGHVRA
jgi:hypothetical protein